MSHGATLTAAESSSKLVASVHENKVLRGEPFGLDHLEQHARLLGQRFGSARVSHRRDREFKRRFEENARILREAHTETCRAIRAGEPMTPEAEWLLDNFHVVEEQLREIVDDLPERFYRELPKIESGEPRVYVLAIELLVHTDSSLDEDTIARCVHAFQESAPLSIGETWAFPIMLRLGLVENLRRLAAQMLLRRQHREQACRILDEWKTDSDFPIDAIGSERCNALILHLVEELQKRGVLSVSGLNALERQLACRQTTIDESIRAEHHHQASNQVSIGNVITSMRLISSLNWVLFFERTNLAEAILRKDPAGVYSQMDFASRDRYRHVVEELAKGSRLNDREVAQQVLTLAGDATSRPRDTGLETHIGFYLLDAGRPLLERIVSFRPRLRQRISRAMIRHPHLTFLGGVFLLTDVLVAVVIGAATAITSSTTIGVILGALAMIPASELAVNLINLLITTLLQPRLIPKLEFKDGLPPSAAAFVVIPSMLASRKDIDSLVERLELHYLANPEPELRFALLTDFRDAPEQSLPDDDDLVSHAVAAIRRLNEQYGTDKRKPFFLFHRQRRWNAAENSWMGWERKRGKLSEFNHLLRGHDSVSYSVCEGDIATFNRERHAIQFVITLDADTQLPYGAAVRMIGALSHPLNRPRFAEHHGGLIGGYSLLQPRLTVHLASANRSRFSRINANSAGVDPYATCASDVYQDLYGEGSFTGKGIYDVDAFEKSLVDAFPENHILSHDLIEGCHARVALVSDIELFDGYPARYDSETQRTHRWVRGDWQLLPWLFSKVPTASGANRCRPNRLSLLSRWKIVDNLRRSLVAPTLLAFLLTGWIASPRLALFTTVAGIAAAFFPLVAQIASALRGRSAAILWQNLTTTLTQDMPRTLMQCLLGIVFLPHKAWVMTDAIVRTLGRMFVSRKRLLEWETADAAERRLSQQKHFRLSSLWFPTFLAVGLSFALPLGSLIAALPWLLAWVGAPAIANWLNQPFLKRESPLTESQTRRLRRLARRTWSFFEMFVNPQDNWLPPDNFQEYPGEKIASRISPTNEGLFLVSALVARDFGYLSLRDLGQLLENNLAVWSRFDRFHGHFYNWYETRTLQPLPPRYISTVDSGNLAASFLTVREGLIELLGKPVFDRSLWQGLNDTLDELEESCRRLQPRGAHQVSPPLDNLTAALSSFRRDLPNGLIEWHEFLKDWHVQGAEFSLRLGEFDASGRFPDIGIVDKGGHFLSVLNGLRLEFGELFPWATLVAESRRSERPSVNNNADANAPPLAWMSPADSRHEIWKRLWTELIAARSPNALAHSGDDWRSLLNELKGATTSPAEQSWIDSLAAAREQSAESARRLIDRYQKLAVHVETLAQEMDFRFLYNAQRRLFSIGYNIEDERLDRAHYDMLCSEARLASYLAISNGNVEHRHWFQLGRPMTRTAGQTALLSWGGTMFEYLMPRLFQRTEPGSLLDHSMRVAVDRQIEYGRQRGVPWGISESAFGALAANSDYHYQSFGVPGLGLKRGLAKDLVVSPYSTMLAVEVAPQAACDNLTALDEEGGFGPWGFYDSLDYSADRVPPGKRCIVVRCYMSHHQGMGLVALGNLLESEGTRRRFHSHPLGRAAELLLQEKIPRLIAEVQPHADEVAERPPLPQEDELVSRRITGTEAPAPRTHVLSNGQYTVMVTHTGGGFSQHQDLAVTRWRPDTTCDPWGQFLYIRNVRSGKVWSAAYQPTRVQPDAYEVLYSIDKADFHRRDGDLESHLEVTVSTENNVELRQLKLTNHGTEPVECDVTSYCEIVLNRQGADLAHPAFQNLFVETEYAASQTALLASRRPRDSKEKPVWALHVFSGPAEAIASVQYETSRARFLGRRHTVAAPAALESNASLSGTTGTVLDPIFSLRCRVKLGPNESISVGFATGVAATREEALLLAEQFHDPRGIQRGFELAWAYHQVELRHLHLSAARAHLYQRLASYLLYPDATFRGEESVIATNRLGQSSLWKYGISGDVPLMLVHVTKPEQLPNVKELLLAHEYWNRLGLKIDLGLINDYPGSYVDSLNEQLVGALSGLQHSPDAKVRGVYLLRAAQMTPEDQTLLETAASVVWNVEEGSVARQLANRPQRARSSASGDHSSEAHLAPRQQLGFISRHAAGGQQPPVPATVTPGNLTLWNGHGGLTEDGREYVIRLASGQTTPMPWSNVIANPRFGCLVTESGGGCTWGANSREYKLTRWSNDPVGDPPSELIFVRDDDRDETIRPMTVIPNDAAVEVRHGQGYSRFLRGSPGLAHDVLISIAPEDPVKFVVLKLTNTETQSRRLTVTYFAELVLGVNREQTQLHVVTETDTQTGALLARNSYHPDLPKCVAFLQVLGDNRVATGDRTAFFGRNRDVLLPSGITHAALSPHTGAGLDPCGVIQTTVEIPPQATTEVVFLLGVGDDAVEARELLSRYATREAVQQAIDQNIARWDDLLGSLQVQTPVPSLNLLANRWLPYQTLSCRIWGRTAFYQSGGAFGFRDQLQDVLSLVYVRSELAREHLLRAASRQFVEGDVQHWWHPPTGRGTRTRFSDDYLWLVYAACHYVEATGDTDLWRESVSFLQSPPLEPQEEERYELPKVSSESASFYEHCRRALRRGFRLGAHGLPLMGCGDWNDGMNKVGHDGRGESVWVGWFVLVVTQQFVPIMEQEGDASEALELVQQAGQLSKSLESQAWDGEWYRRAFYDDGTPLGSKESDECQIDSLAQSWAVIAGANAERSRSGMEAVWKTLISTKEQLALLFAPPFDKGQHDPGYIKGYPPGIRENGGQYTHAATWIVRAFARMHDPDRALAVWRLLNPLEQATDAASVDRYQVEPYAVAADVYGVPPNRGRGGWTWYTGSSGWLYRVLTEDILGLRVMGSRFRIQPCIPKDWPEFSITYRRAGTTWNIRVIHDTSANARTAVEIDGVRSDGNEFELQADSQVHSVVLTWVPRPDIPLATVVERSLP